MRRYIFALAWCLLLLSCKNEQAGVLPPAEVLRRAAEAATALESVRYTLTGDVSFQGDGRSTFHLAFQGILRDAGKESQTTARITGTTALGGKQSSVDSTAEVLVASPTEVYVRLKSIAVTPPNALFSSEAFQRLIGRWWLVPPASQDKTAQPVTADPSLLRAQAETVRVVKDRGLREINGKQAYVYDVALDREKALLFMKKSAEAKGQMFVESDARSFLESFNATGELWVDATSFVIHRLMWDIVPQSVTDKEFTASVTIDFTDHGKAPMITPPKDAQPLSVDTLLEALSGATLPSLPHG